MFQRFFFSYLLGLLLAIFLTINPLNAKEMRQPSQMNTIDGLNNIKKVRSLVTRSLWQNFALSDNVIIENYTHFLAENLLFSGAINPRNFQFYLAYNSQLNAFAAADGIILLTSEIVNQVEKVDEFVSVMAHEISHITQNHYFRSKKLAKSGALTMGLGILAAVLAKNGAASRALIFGSISVNSRNRLQYSREFEWEADRLAISLMNKSGFNAKYLVSFLKKLDSNTLIKDKSVEFLRTHPLTTSRIAEAAARVARITRGLKSDSLLTKNYDNVSLLSEEFIFYQALVNYYSQSEKILKNSDAKQLVNWLKKVNFDKLNFQSSGDNLNSALSSANNSLAEQINQMVKKYPDSRILMIIQIHYLLENINQNGDKTKIKMAKIKENLDFFKMLYPDYYPAIYYQAWFDSINANKTQAAKIIKNLLTKQNIQSGVPFYFTSGSKLAEKIATKQQLKIELQWAKAVNFDIKNDFNQARKYYYLAIKAADELGDSQFALFLKQKLNQIHQ